MKWMFPRAEQGLVSVRWQGDQLVVQRDDEVIDGWRESDIERVVLVHAGEGESPGDVRAALFELTDRVVLLSAVSGVVARVLFERQAFWSRRRCIWWAADSSVTWTSLFDPGRWPMRARLPRYKVVPRAASSAWLEHAQVTGPHTWDERKHYRIERRRPFRGHAIATTPLHSGLPS